MSVPKRIHWNRFAGKPLPANTRLIARPSRFGNPFTIAGAIEHRYATTETEARDVCVTAFQRWLDGEHKYAGFLPERRQLLLDGLPLIVGMDLACPCPEDQPCHGDVLLAAAARLGSGGAEVGTA